MTITEMEEKANKDDGFICIEFGEFREIIRKKDISHVTMTDRGEFCDDPDKRWYCYFEMRVGFAFPIELSDAKATELFDAVRGK